MENNRPLIFNIDSNEDLKKNKDFLFKYTRTMQIYRSNAIYTYIPKNACSFFRYNIGKANGFINENNKDFIHNNNHNFIPSFKDIQKANFIFVVLRNPLDRLVSCYLSLIVNRVQNNLLDDPLIKIFGAKISFENFVNKIKNENLINLNEHWKPQYKFLIVKNYDFYLNINDISSSKDYLEKNIGVKLIDTYSLFDHTKYKMDKIDTKLDCYGLEPFEVVEKFIKKKCIPKYKYFYNQNLINLIKELYLIDIDLYKEKFKIDPIDELEN